ncbi:hypothetical protein HHK36_030741 [Tetracentron sinense]|uniref:J domain-containing protein n=1 Tax=Tetracentron sinense TaxID=13715 RepID=A0A834YDC7_TETSI|nr:hypothetical protein HHK36_030741 [Tetracentron sinense]
MEGNSNRAEAERCLEIAEKLLVARDLVGSKRFANRAQESCPLHEGSDQILAVADVLLAAEKRINNHLDWYAILQLDRQTEDLELIKNHYRRLALILNPNKNKVLYADNAFKLVADAWAVLSNPSKKSPYDNELSLFSKIDSEKDQQKQPLRQSPRKKKRNSAEEQPESSSGLPVSGFWTACPYCYILYEYPRVYEECCLRCQNCQRGFHAVSIPSPPPVVPGKEAYFCCWGFFPLGFCPDKSESGKNAGFPNWMPNFPMFPCPQSEEKRDTAAPKTSLDDQDSLVEISDSPAEWGSRKKGTSVITKEKGLENRNVNRSQPAETAKGEQNIPGQGKKGGSQSLGGVEEVPDVAVKRKKTVAKKSTKLQIGDASKSKKRAHELETLDLNEEVRNEVENTVPEMAEGLRAEISKDDAAEGIEFFDGLDEFLGRLPIFSVVGDEKVKAA